jgi:hypothetical protein
MACAEPMTEPSRQYGTRSPARSAWLRRPGTSDTGRRRSGSISYPAQSGWSRHRDMCRSAWGPGRRWHDKSMIHLIFDIGGFEFASRLTLSDFSGSRQIFRGRAFSLTISALRKAKVARGLPCSTWKRAQLVLTTAQLALRPRKAGIWRTFSSIKLPTAEERPH